MPNEFIIRTLIEFSAIVLLIVGFICEDKIIKFEESVKRVIVGNYRRYKRLRRKDNEIF